MIRMIAMVKLFMSLPSRMNKFRYPGLALGADRICVLQSYVSRENTYMPASDSPSSRAVVVALIMAIMIVVPSVVKGQEKVKLPGDDWISLFNGNDLNGWTKIGNESWNAEDGLIHGKGLTKDYGYLQ